MKIAVTGSRGTLGRPLVEALRKKGHKVFGIDLQHHDDPDHQRADVGNFRELERALRRADPEMVYHLAAEFGRMNGEDYPERVWTTNAVGTKNILTLQREMKWKLIFASSSEVYGESDIKLLSEDVLEKTPVRYFNDYAMSKRVNEWQIQNAIERDKAQVMTLRFFNAYGPGEHYHPYRSVVCLFAYRALHNIPITVYEDYHRVFMYIDDFLPTLTGCAEKFRPGETFNIGGREYRPVKDLAHLILKGVPSYSQELVTWASRESMNVANKRPDITKAVEVLGHNPRTTLEEGVPATLAWMREVYQK